MGKGRSMAYFSTPEKANDKRKSTTCMHRNEHECTTTMDGCKLAMRKLKTGKQATTFFFSLVRGGTGHAGQTAGAPQDRV